MQEPSIKPHIDYQTDLPGDRRFYRGVIVPLVTPVTATRNVDEAGFRALLDHIASGSVRGFLVGGTTGEAASMEDAQRRRLVEVAREHLGEEAMVYAGIGSNCLSASLRLAREALEVGADAVVAHPPSYYPLLQPEIRQWYLDLADAVPGPLLIYNIPSTTRVSIDLDNIRYLSRHPNIVGVKDSEFDEDRLTAVIAAFRQRKDFQVFAGPTAFGARAIELGAAGFIPSLGNIIPATMQQVFESAERGEVEKAHNLQAEALKLNDVYLKGQTPGYAIADIKALLELMGICSSHMMPPLIKAPPTRRDHLRQLAIEFGLI